MAQNTTFSDIEAGMADWQKKSALIVMVMLLAGIISMGITIMSSFNDSVATIEGQEMADDHSLEMLRNLASSNDDDI